VLLATFFFPAGVLILLILNGGDGRGLTVRTHSLTVVVGLLGWLGIKRMELNFTASDIFLLLEKNATARKNRFPFLSPNVWVLH
jgi:hypothetical protein